jgi:hypothetical protein
VKIRRTWALCGAAKAMNFSLFRKVPLRSLSFHCGAFIAVSVFIYAIRISAFLPAAELI